jgi:hypothetical protein
MEKTMFRCFGLLMLFALVIGSSCQQAAADDGPAVVIRNAAHAAIPYQLRVGEGEWKDKLILPGYSQTYRWAYGQKLTSRFDWIGGDGYVTVKSYNLRPGGRYVFRYSRDGHYLDLYRDK